MIMNPVYVVFAFRKTVLERSIPNGFITGIIHRWETGGPYRFARVGLRDLSSAPKEREIRDK